MAYHHDDFHRAKRMKAGLHYPALVEVARNGLKKILEELPEYSEKSLQKDSMGGSWIEQVNKDDCYRWIVDFMIDLIIDAEFTSFDADPHKDPSSYCETLFQEMIKKTFDTIRSETFIDRDGKEGVRGVGGYIRIGTNKTLEAEWTDKLMAALKEKDLGSAILSRIVPPSS